MSILVADDHPVVLQAVCRFLISRQYDIVAACSNGADAWQSISLLKPSIALLDHTMPVYTGIEIAEKIRDAKLSIKVVILTMHKEKSLLDRAIETGVHGFLLKDFAMQEIEECLRSVNAGMKYYSRNIGYQNAEEEYIKVLSPAEQKILHILATNKTQQQVADHLFIPLRSVEEHSSNIISKLGLPPGNSSIAEWAAENIK